MFDELATEIYDWARGKFSYEQRPTEIEADYYARYGKRIKVELLD